MKSRFHEAAAVDLADNYQYYDEASPGLGDQFVADTRAAVKFLEQFPQAAPEISGDVRGKTLTRFPHTLLYVVHAQELVILAVAHQRQDRHEWLRIVRARRPGG